MILDISHAVPQFRDEHLPEIHMTLVTSRFHTLKAEIGTSPGIEGWPANDLSGLFQALDQWTLDPLLDMSGDDAEHPHARFDAPYRCLAWCQCVEERIANRAVYKTRFVGTTPIYADHPDAVSYCGNFLGFSFCFNIDTADAELIKKMDLLIAENMARPEYIEAKAEHRKRRR